MQVLKNDFQVFEATLHDFAISEVAALTFEFRGTAPSYRMWTGGFERQMR